MYKKKDIRIYYFQLFFQGWSMFCSFADKENDFTEDDVIGFFEMMLNKNIQSGLFHILSTVFLLNLS